MKILGISASASKSSSNFYLLKSIQDLYAEKDEMQVFEGLQEFALFSPAQLEKGIPKNIKNLKQQILKADLIIISTPEYTHNIPAVLKNVLEWCTASGEFSEKAVLPITFTPKEPRGEHAMTSLLQSLQTMKAKIETRLPLYKSDVIISSHQIELPKDIQEIITTAIGLYR
ncbi:NAD(P)H-dependent FMN reductase [Salegentibacter echinorum]|uniref:NAD(P)H-dependent FMN reductase n=1 Tax=Salegentibacter echinorum TaxID=1073325 RepID=A0A1M5KN15_SALEC|nr:NAD(P)H-dependent oxidoreductase [Salegentibacter echinorum]SHG54151.1 NAD(P)H-dependent FMN reductase [Salegentibacter echinorum]